MLSQAGGPCQVGGVTDPFRIGSEGEGDSEVVRAVAGPVPALKERRELVELVPGRGWFECDPGLFCGLAVLLALECLGPIRQHEGRAAVGEGHAVFSVLGNLLAEGRDDVTELEGVNLRGLFLLLGWIGIALGPNGRADEALGQDEQGLGIHEVAQQVGPEDDDMGRARGGRIDRLLLDPARGPSTRFPFAALGVNGLQDGRIPTAPTTT